MLMACIFVERGTCMDITTKQLAFAALAITLATIVSMVPLFNMPMGGTVTPCSMLFIALIGYWYGLPMGICTGVAYGMLQFIMHPYMLSIPQVITDYILSFGALGVSGLFANQPNSLWKAYLLGCLGRFCFAVISGCLFFAYYVPEYYNSALLYSMAYNISYIGPEAVITLVFISLPQVKKALNHVYSMTRA